MFSAGEHGRHDVRVVNLPSTNGNFATEAHQRLGNQGAILKYLEAASQLLTSSRASSRVIPTGQAADV